jgi:hypothetical protein
MSACVGRSAPEAARLACPDVPVRVVTRAAGSLAARTGAVTPVRGT